MNQSQVYIAISFVSYFVLLILGIYCDFVLKSYLRNKPFGMQTFLDKVMCHFLTVRSVGNFCALLILGIIEPLQTTGNTVFPINLVTWFCCFVALFFVFSVCSVLAIRYENKHKPSSVTFTKFSVYF